MAGVKGKSGGVRAGSGRKPKAEEERVQALALKAIVDQYGSEEAGFRSLITSGDSGLRRWVFEHAYGKPKEKLDVKHEGGVSILFKRATDGSD